PSGRLGRRSPGSVPTYGSVLTHLPAGYGKVAVLDELQATLQIGPDRIIYVGQPRRFCSWLAADRRAVSRPPRVSAGTAAVVEREPGGAQVETALEAAELEPGCASGGRLLPEPRGSRAGDRDHRLVPRRVPGSRRGGPGPRHADAAPHHRARGAGEARQGGARPDRRVPRRHEDHLPAGVTSWPSRALRRSSGRRPTAGRTPCATRSSAPTRRCGASPA